MGVLGIKARLKFFSFFFVCAFITSSTSFFTNFFISSISLRVSTVTVTPLGKVTLQDEEPFSFETKTIKLEIKK